MTERWYCVETKPFEGHRATWWIEQMQFELCKPTYQTKRVTKKRTVAITERPLFPGYLLTRFDTEIEGWQRINGAPGVKRLMSGASEQPLPISDRYMLDLVGRVKSGPILNLSELEMFQRGEQLKVLEGPFEGHEGKCEWSNSERTSVLLSLFGRSTPVKVRTADVELAG